ncbi:MAG: DEAD/DEAH box helicase family protein [Verrucomicrobiota bacterium]|nr:DEAD/DEAH box helicase family protein [Verrucomicrobiota bacterium]
MALKRSRPEADDNQLDLFVYATSGANPTDSVRHDGRETLAGIPTHDGQRNGSQRNSSGNAFGSGREHGRGADGLDFPVYEGRINGAAGARPSLGNCEGEIHLFGARNGNVERNPNNYRITETDLVGEGSIREKCRGNLAAIRLLKQLQAECRPADDKEKSLLVRYVGWGGIPQIFTPAADWRTANAELSSLLSEAEFRAARASTLNAHYTAGKVIMAMYAALERMGFEQGRILEPACGVGHFIGFMPERIHSRSTITGIEIDPVTAGIAKALYPDADIRSQPFENAKLNDDYYDLAISNIPFGDYKPFDPKFNEHGFLIHDYFFAAALDKVRPGGLIAFISSKGTMDKIDSSLRDHLARQAELIGAIRLPNDAFKRNANTEVTTDIIFLRKLALNETPRSTTWKNVVPHTNSRGEVIPINEYFAKRAHMMLGEMRLKGRMYQRNGPTLVSDKRDIGKGLAAAIENLPERIYQPLQQSVVLPQADERIPAPGEVKPNAYTLHNGQIAIRHGDELKLLPHLPSLTASRIRGMIQVRDSVRECLRTQLEENDEPQIELARARLNQSYDRFISRFGPLSSPANRRAFRGDPDRPLLFSLENYDEETDKATKTAIFCERTIHRQQPVESVDSPKAALIVSLNEKGRIDLPHMSRLLNQSVDQFLPDLKGAVFLNPQTKEWETEDRYLSGNVREKLVIAESAAMNDRRFQENVEALKAVQPEDLSATDIDARLGACWIPVKDVETFVRDLLDSQGVSVLYTPQLGTWAVQGDYTAKSAVTNRTDWGTDRASALELIEDALNLRTPTIYDTIRESGSSPKQVVNPVATEAAREKQQKIKDRFKEWIWREDERRERLTRKYNDEFNCIRLRAFNGDHLTLPGASQTVALHSHQKTAVWRILQTPNTLLGHVVGAGKTYSMVAAAMELKRLGLARKPMFAVPNHMLGQFSSELLTLYPGANILAATKEDFEKDKRRELMSRIATGNWDAIIVTHSGFEKIPMSHERRKHFFQTQLDELESAILEQKGNSDTRRIVKQLEAAKKRLETKLQLLAADEKKDNTLTFEELGVDRLFVDEAHFFKNLFYISKMTRVAGLPQTASERAFDMFLKVQYIQSINEGGGVVFATGTPIANSVAEMYTMQRYLQMDALKKQRLHHFDAWAATFGEPVTAMELSPDGAGYRLNTRFARFINVPELMQQFCQVADIQTASTLKLAVPEIQTGKPIVIRAPSTPELKDVVASLVKRAEAIRNGSVKPDQDNMLKITSEGRKAALDLRVLNPLAPNLPDSKLNLAADTIFEIWKGSAEIKGTQLVFCDLSTPAKLQCRFCAYDELKQNLVERGIPASQIAFIQDYDSDIQKHSLFKEVKAGRIRVLLGSTLKMGAGMNVQERLIALHHLDAPWRPADVEQREGRILRQGNQNKSVGIYRYVTEGSFDAYMWQTLETKARFIQQVMTGDTHIRHLEDIDSRALTYAEVKAIASGNPLVMEKASVDAELIRLTRLLSQHADTQYRIRSDIRRLKEEGPAIARKIEALKLDLPLRKDTRGNAFEILIEKIVYKDRGVAGEMLNRIAKRVAGSSMEFEVGSFAGFPLFVRAGYLNQVDLIAKGNAYHAATISDSAHGTIRSLEHSIQTMDERISRAECELTDCQKRCSELGSKLGEPFEHEAKLLSLANRQQELEAALDVTKNQAPNGLAADPTPTADVLDNDQNPESNTGEAHRIKSARSKSSSTRCIRA